MGGRRAGLLLGAGVAATLVAADPLPPAQAVAAASRWNGAWPAAAPPGSVPSHRAVDGPLLGNGDVGLVAGVKDGVLTFYVSKSDFWHLQPMSTPGHGRVTPEGNTQPRALGGVSFSLPNGSSTGLASANSTSPAFALRQDIGRGVVGWNMSLGGAPVLSGWATVSQDDGVSRIVFSLSVPAAAAASAHRTTLSVRTWGAQGGVTEGTAAGGTAWISRRIGGCSNATAAIATSVIGGGASSNLVRVQRGAPTVLVSAVVSSLDLGHRTGQCSWLWRDPVPVAVAR